MRLLSRWLEPDRQVRGRVIVVALHKSGTNLIARLLENLGYRTTGEGIDNRRPSWASSFDGDFLRRFPRGTAYFMHSLPLNQVPSSLAHGWASRHEPRILFHYRDPRAVFASFVNYLMKRNAGRAHSPSGYQTLLSDLLMQLPEAQHIAAVMAAFPQYIRQNFEDNQWLLLHSAVCKTSFEGLVGPAGHASAEAQRASIERVARFLGHPPPDPSVADRLFARDARTFFRGQVDGWREAFSPEDLNTFERLYGAVLDTYGYPRESSSAPQSVEPATPFESRRMADH